MLLYFLKKIYVWFGDDMANSNFNPFLEYLNYSKDIGYFGSKRTIKELDEDIERRIVGILRYLESQPEYILYSNVLDSFFDLADLITERYFDGKKPYISGDTVFFLANELKKNMLHLEMMPELFVDCDEAIRRVNLCSSETGSLLGIFVFDEDRFSNELMVSCSKVRGENTKSSARVITPNYIFGENGVYINATDESFLDTFYGIDTLEFDSTVDLKYFYIDYFNPRRKIYVDRGAGFKTVYENNKFETTCFHKPLLDCVILGGNRRTDDEVLDFICKENNTSTGKVYEKKD